MNTAVKSARRTWRRFVLVFALAVLVSPVMTAAAQSGGIGGRVVNPDPENPRSQSIFIYTLEHGQTKEDQILIMNRTDEEQAITLGSVDGVVTNTGDYTCRQEAEPVEGSGGWVTLEKRQLILPANSEEIVNFTVTVPEGADVGEHNSCITIFQSDQEPAEGEQTGGIHIRMRQAIRMVVTIPGELKRDISIESFFVTLGKGTQKYSLTAANKGNVSADVDMKVGLASRFFNKEIISVGGEYPVVPGESLNKEFESDFKPLFGGWFTITPSLRYDTRLGVFGTNSNEAAYETIIGDSVNIFLWPSMLGWIIILVVLIIVILIVSSITIRKRKRTQLKKRAHPYVVKKDDTLESLAKESKVSWQQLANLNKIKAPYTLEEGQKILLPGAARHAAPKKHHSPKHKA